METIEAKYEVRMVAEGELLEQAKRLHAHVYLRRGFVGQEHLSSGVLHDGADPYQHHADYFVAVDKETGLVAALARQVHQRGGALLPMLRYASRPEAFQAMDREDVVEISAFVKRPGAESQVIYLLFREMLRYSRERSHRYWVMVCDVNVYWGLRILLGPVIQRAGSRAYYMGSDVMPAKINIERSAQMLQWGYVLSLPPLRAMRKFLHISVSGASRAPVGGRA